MWTVSGSDLNAATALLHLWWGVWEAAAGTDLSQRLNHLLHDDIVVESHDRRAEGRAAVTAMLLDRPRTISFAHHLVALEIEETAQGDIALQVQLLRQIRDPAGNVENREVHDRLVLQKAESGVLKFKHITLPQGELVEPRAFSSTTTLNRAKATVIEFQTYVDRLDGTADGLERLITEDATFHGLMATDQPLTGIEGLAGWLAGGPAAFRWVRHNQLLSFDLTTLGEGRYEAIATFEWLAETHDGERMERRTPIRWTLIDTGDIFMKIERIN